MWTAAMCPERDPETSASGNHEARVVFHPLPREAEGAPLRWVRLLPLGEVAGLREPRDSIRVEPCSSWSEKRRIGSGKRERSDDHCARGEEELYGLTRLQKDSFTMDKPTGAKREYPGNLRTGTKRLRWTRR